MDPQPFEARFQEILDKNAEEGPHTNIFEPKFKAREQAEQLQAALANLIQDPTTADDVLFRAQEQLARVFNFIANNMFETEEEKNALDMVCRAHSIILHCTKQQRADVSPAGKSDVHDVLVADRVPTWKDIPSGFAFAATLADVLNSLGVFFSNRDDHKQRLGDAIHVLKLAEGIYTEWSAHEAANHGYSNIAALPLDERGILKIAEGTDDATADRLRYQHRMEGVYNSTVFFLAQAYGAEQNMPEASKYIHQTLLRQLISRKDYSKREWATNALHLSNFYTAEEDFGEALYCILSAEHIMPREPDNEETVGKVMLAKGRFFKVYLKHWSDRARVGALQEDYAPGSDRLHMAQWWQDFPIEGVPSPAPMAAITTFDRARDMFKQSMVLLQGAHKYFYIDGFCNDYISIHQDMSDLYGALIPFEENIDRQIAMHQRRAQHLENIPGQLNFEVYMTTVRQLWFNLGDIYADMADLYIKQKNEKIGGKPLSDKQLNFVVDKAKGFFDQFVRSYDAKGTTAPPAKMEKDQIPAYIRAMMRGARLEGRNFAKTAKDEYDMIGRVIKRYEGVLEFAAAQNVKDEGLAHELSLCREMVALLPGKQQNIMKTFAR